MERYGFQEIHNEAKMLFDLKVFYQFTKFPIALSITMSFALGYILFPQKEIEKIHYTLLGVFLLSCGAAALNQYQEKDIDALLHRTQHRPLPSGQISNKKALSLLLFLCMAGLFLLFLNASLEALGLGIFSLVWYNGVYTPLKRKTIWAAIPGSLIGAIPPLLGWVCAGGSLVDKAIIQVSLFFFFWQIPHFWLLMLCHQEDYRESTLPSLVRALGVSHTQKIAFYALVATVTVSLPVIGHIESYILKDILFAFGFVLLIVSQKILYSQDLKKNKKLFFLINLYALLITLFLCIENLP